MQQHSSTANQPSCGSICTVGCCVLRGGPSSRLLQVLLEEVAKLYDTVTPQDVLVAAPEELIFLTMSSLVQPGDTVITTYPGLPCPHARRCHSPRTAADAKTVDLMLCSAQLVELNTCHVLNMLHRTVQRVE